MVAMKQIKLEDVDKDERYAIKFLSETNHENIVKLYHAVKADNYKYANG